MNLTVKEALAIIFIVGIITAATRALPFLLFPDNKKKPDFILYLGKVLPFAIMGMLIVYCLKKVSIISYPFGIPEVIAILIVAVLHLWKKNTLISIFGGTAIYMTLVQYIFV